MCAIAKAKIQVAPKWCTRRSDDFACGFRVQSINMQSDSKQKERKSEYRRRQNRESFSLGWLCVHPLISNFRVVRSKQSTEIERGGVFHPLFVTFDNPKLRQRHRWSERRRQGGDRGCRFSAAAERLLAERKRQSVECGGGGEKHPCARSHTHTHTGLNSVPLSPPSHGRPCVSVDVAHWT
jgi:hypothetical protein